MKFLKRLLLLCLMLVLMGAVALTVYRLVFVTYIDPHEFGYQIDKTKGEYQHIGRSGYIHYNPLFVTTNTIDTRPFQVCVRSGVEKSSKIVSCKQIRFNPDGIEEYLKLTGGGLSRHAFISKMTEVAYDVSGVKYPFLDIIAEMREANDGNSQMLGTNNKGE